MSQNVYMLPFVKKKFSNLQETFQNIFEDGYKEYKQNKTTKGARKQTFG